MNKPSRMSQLMSDQHMNRTATTLSREALLRLDAQGYIVDSNLLAREWLNITESGPFPHIDDLGFVEISNESNHFPNGVNIWIIIKELSNASSIQAYLVRHNELKWFDIQVNHADEPSYFDLSIIDISNIAVQFKDLKKSESHLKSLVSSLDDIVFELSCTGIFKNCWTNNEKLLFQKPSAFLGKSLLEVMPRELAKKILTAIQYVINNSCTWVMDFHAPPHIQKDKWYRLRIKPIAHHDDAVIVVVSDITDTKVLELEQKIQEKKFNQAFQFSGIGMAIVSLEGECLDANSMLLNMLGLDEHQIYSYNFIENTHDDDLPKTLEYKEKLITGELHSYTFEKRYKHANGHYIWCSSTMSVVHDSEGKGLFLINQLMDITESKQNLTILQSQKSELESIKIDLESKIKQLEEFNQIVSHNLRGPASNIRMLTDAILAYNENVDPTLKQYVEFLKTSSDNLIDTLQDLSTIIEVHSPKSLRYETCKFDILYQKIIDQFSVEIAKTETIITTDFKVKQLLYPKVYLESILYNLVSNAIKYRVEDRKPEIHISTCLMNDKIILKVKDNGIGIDVSKYKNKIFAFRNIFHTGFDSRGVGLFLTRYQVETLGGKIYVDSTPNEGSTFTVEF